MTAAALASEPAGENRTLILVENPRATAHPVFVVGKVATVLIFDSAVDSANTKLLAWEGRFEPPLVGTNKVVLEPKRDLARNEDVPLLVTLADGTEIPFLVRPATPQQAQPVDHQIRVFKDNDSYDAVYAALQDSLKREDALRAQIKHLEENKERSAKEETSTDHALATLLVNGELEKTPFRRKRHWHFDKDDVDLHVEAFRGPGKAALIFTLKNTYYGQPWKLDAASLTSLASYTARPFALRMNRTEIVTGQSGKIAIVVDKSAFETKDGEIANLILQLFRTDGLVQTAVTLTPELIGQER